MEDLEKKSYCLIGYTFKVNNGIVLGSLCLNTTNKSEQEVKAEVRSLYSYPADSYEIIIFSRSIFESEEAYKRWLDI